jgi:hypothetical protein
MKIKELRAMTIQDIKEGIFGWLIVKVMPGYHLHKNPVKKEREG